MEKNIVNFSSDIKRLIEESIKVKEEISDKQLTIINNVAHVIIDAYKKEKKVLWFGNGGSAADAQHLACELVSKFYLERKPLSSMALTTNTSLLTAISNDSSYEKVFERQVDAFANEGDVLIGITTSGTSPNIIKALKAGRKKGTINVALTGKYVHKIKDYVDFLVDVPSTDTPRIQESHIMIGHILCYLVEKTLFKD